jgi:ATP phosphoribosyltransferase regulatory subunit
MNGAHTLVQTPPGVQCFVGDEARRRREIEDRVLSVFRGWDFEEIIPPLFDYADVFSEPSLGSKTYSFLGRDGAVLALRPDFTSLLAKIAAGRLSDRALPMRLYYSGEVLRYEPPRAGRQSELYQMGLERLGGDGRAGEVEVLAIAAESLESAGARDFVLTLGHVGVFSALIAECDLAPAVEAALRDRVEAKDRDGVREVLARSAARATLQEAMLHLTELSGGTDILTEARTVLAGFEGALRATDELLGTIRALEAAGLGARLAVDLGEVRGLDYYTGLVFRIYAKGLGFEVGGGGRYDGLLGRFGRPMSAVGFMLGLDRLDLLLTRQSVELGDDTADPVRVTGSSLAEALIAARRRRAEGERVCFVEGRGK